MVIGIDASSIRAGGGITHLKELLHYANPDKAGISKVIIWSGKYSLDQLPNYDWLQKVEVPILNKSFPFRVYWQLFKLDKVLKQVDVLFSPSGTYTGSFRPYVSMSQNMLIFEHEESSRFGLLSWMKLRFTILEKTQSKSFRNATGLIFISNYAQSFISKKLELTDKKKEIIYHGISERFRRSPKKQLPISEYSKDKPYRLIYVSIINVYKHQWNVVEAVQRLRSEGLPIQLDLVGPAYNPALKLLKKSLSKDSKSEEYINYHGNINFQEIEKLYHNSDAFIFASSCENMPNILIEAMSASLPIACSNMGPMPEILKDAGIYFNPLKTEEIFTALQKLILNLELRELYINKAYAYSEKFSWETCAQRTFQFIANCKNL